MSLVYCAHCCDLIVVSNCRYLLWQYAPSFLLKILNHLPWHRVVGENLVVVSEESSLFLAQWLTRSNPVGDLDVRSMHEEFPEANKPVSFSRSPGTNAHDSPIEKSAQEKEKPSDHQDDPTIEIADLLSRFKVPSQVVESTQSASESFW